MDFSTTYLGLNLKTPVVPSSNPLMRHVSNIRRMEDAGAGAVVLHSLFEEEIDAESYALDYYLTEGTESFPEALSYFPEAPAYARIGPDAYLEHIRAAKAAVDMPIIASLNGVSPGGWSNYARHIADAGADALELNVYFVATNLSMSGNLVEQLYLNILRDVKAVIDIPVAMKLNPYFSSLANMSQQLITAGADGLVLFNRFYQPDIDLINLDVDRSLVLSSSAELRLPLRWIALLYGRINASLALTTGVHSAEDALKGIAAGADVVMMASALLHHGIDHIKTVLDGMRDHLLEYEYDSLDQLRGSLSQINCRAPAAFERANYVQTIGFANPYPVHSVAETYH
jgi:dihydroorotate dehydrogenase (fumarate)